MSLKADPNDKHSRLCEVLDEMEYLDISHHSLGVEYARLMAEIEPDFLKYSRRLTRTDKENIQLLTREHFYRDDLFIADPYFVYEKVKQNLDYEDKKYTIGHAIYDLAEHPKFFEYVGCSLVRGSFFHCGEDQSDDYYLYQEYNKILKQLFWEDAFWKGQTPKARDCKQKV